MTRDALARRLAWRAARDPVLRALRDAAASTGTDLLVVGGTVRDAALGRTARDLDLVAGRGSKRLVETVEARLGTRGFRFRKRGVTTWRTTIGGREVDVVDAARRGIDADLRRRDFTINAVGYDLVGGRIVDPVGGLRDLGRGILRLPRPDAIADDPLRALRAARFLAKLPGARLARGLEGEIARHAGRLRRVSVERIRDEVDRLLASPDPARGLRAVASLGLLPGVLPEMTPTTTCVAGAGRPSVWEHTVLAIEAAARRRSRDPDDDLVLRWAVLLHDVAKPETLRIDGSGRPTFHGHEVLGARRADAILARLRQPRSLRRRVARIVLHHLRPHHLVESGATPRAIRRLARDLEDDAPLLVRHAIADARGSGDPDRAGREPALRAVCRRLLEAHAARRRAAPEPLVDGRDVMREAGIPAGPRVGEILEEIAELRAEGTLRGRDAALRWIRERLGDRRQHRRHQRAPGGREPA